MRSAGRDTEISRLLLFRGRDLLLFLVDLGFTVFFLLEIVFLAVLGIGR